MADETPQSYAHHTRWDPSFHFFLAPVFPVKKTPAVGHLRGRALETSWQL